MENNTQKSKRNVAQYIASAVILLAANLLFFLLLWLVQRYDKVQFDQILYQIKSSSVGANSDLSTGAALRVGVFGFALTGLEILLYRVLSGKAKRLGLKNSGAYVKYTATRVCRFFKKKALAITSVFLLMSVIIFIARLDVIAYVSTTSTPSDFIEKNYVDPMEAELTFPEEKRNLVYIFLESMENTFSDPTAGGLVTDDFIPELTKLREENISFSNTEGIGGALSFTGTTWTAAAMFSQTAGMIVKVPIFAKDYEDEYLPGLNSLGDVLLSEGYHQAVLMGSDSRFACRDRYFTEHGDYEIIDTTSLKADGRLDPDYREWWGFEDKMLFDYAKEELTRIAALGEPFNFTLLTADTHFPDGYLCSECPDSFDEQYSNVLHCSSMMVYEFVEWMKTQDFYSNTTVILSGDHLTMDPEFLEDINKDYTRTVYNCFINSAVDTEYTKNRLFGTYDMLPTTLAAMGVEIEGDRLGLGTDLFSGRKTLTEEYGFDFLNNELQKKSEYYNKVFYDKKRESSV